MGVVNARRCQGVLPADLLVPDPAAAPDDRQSDAACFDGLEASELHVCSFGPPDATVRLAAVGDSHSNQLLAAYRQIALARGWRIDVAGHNGCYWTTAVQDKPTQAMVDACTAWKSAVGRWLAQAPGYDAILVTMARSRSLAVAGPDEDPVDAAVLGLVGAWSSVRPLHTRVIAIRDNPAMTADTVSCVAEHMDRANAACSRPAASALGARDALAEAVARDPDARLVDLTDLYCPDGRCMVVIGHVVVFADRDHVTATWARSLAPVLADRIDAAMR
jgi:hypothetical protein